MKYRFELRRSRQVPMEVITSHWDEPVWLQTGDLSPRGAYIESNYMPNLGEHVVCSFRLGKKKSYDFFGQVTRVNLGRRRADAGPAGFGVEFLDCTPLERLQIRDALKGTPPPVPVMRNIRKQSPVKKRGQPIF